MLDISKAQNLLLIKNIYDNSTHRLLTSNQKGEFTYNYLYEINGIYSILVARQLENGDGIISTILPNRTKRNVQNKIASAIRTEAKSSTNQ